jgi:hypothetical protein
MATNPPHDGQAHAAGTPRRDETSRLVQLDGTDRAGETNPGIMTNKQLDGTDPGDGTSPGEGIDPGDGTCPGEGIDPGIDPAIDLHREDGTSLL